MKNLQEQIREEAKELCNHRFGLAGKIKYGDIYEQGIIAGANFILSKWQESERWRKVEEKLPHFDDGLVLVKVRNKNKENGIFLYDICYIDEETNTWGKRYHTWEDIIEWKPIK